MSETTENTKPTPEETPVAEETPITMQAAVDLVREHFPESIEEVVEFRGETTIRIRTSDIADVCRLLRDDPEVRFDFLTAVMGVDYPEREPRFDVVYQVYSTTKHHRLRLKVGAAIDQQVPSVTGVWPAAGWDEREVFDMYGVLFSGHPDLKRILMPPDWEGHPFRKDYPLQGYPGFAERWFEKQLEIPEE